MDATPIIIKKKKAAAHGHHGGSWKVAYADFVTAMMAFFMVMWIMGLSDATRAQIQGYFNDPIAFDKLHERGKVVIQPPGATTNRPQKTQKRQDQAYQDEHKDMKDLKKEMQEKLAKDPKLKGLMSHVSFELTPEGLRIELIEDKSVFFESGQAILKPEALALIRQIAPQLAASKRAMGIEGHTDSVPFGGDPYGNHALSTDRANSLGRALEQSGVSSERILYATGYADKHLRDPAHPTSSINRRVTILLPYETPLDAKTTMPKDEVRRAIKGAVVPPVSVGPITPSITQMKS